MGFIKHTVQHMHGWFAVERVPMLLGHVLQWLHLGVDAVGSIIVSKGCCELFEDVVKLYKPLYLQYHNSSGFGVLLFVFFFSRLPLFLQWKKAT